MIENNNGFFHWDSDDAHGTSHVFTVVGDSIDVISNGIGFNIIYDGLGSFIFTMEIDEIFSSSSSSSLDSSSSSSYLDAHDDKFIPFVFKSEKLDPIWIMKMHGDYVYAGTGSDGVLLRSKDRRIWSEFYRVDDNHIIDLAIHNHKLFIATSPKGKLYSINLLTDEIELIQTLNDGIVDLCKFRDVLYVATKNDIYVYDSGKFDFFYRPYAPVNVMLNALGLLYLFMEGEDVAHYDGTEWVIEPMDLDNVAENIQSYRRVSTEPYSYNEGRFIDRAEVKGVDGLSSEDIVNIFPKNRNMGIRCVASNGTTLTLGGEKSRVYNYS